jgi:hypothetical protein
LEGLCADLGHPALLPTLGGARRLLTNEFGANLTVASPDHLASLDNSVAGEEQDKFIGNMEPHDVQPHACIGNIENQALARWSAGPDPQLRPMVEVAAR